MPCLRVFRKEVLESKNGVAESHARLQNAGRTIEYTKECERHRRVKRAERAFERKQRSAAVRSICEDLEAAYETGRQYRLLRNLGFNLKEDDHSGIEVITPESCKKHFVKIGGDPNEPVLSVTESVTQKQVRADSDREPSFAEFRKTLK